MNGLYNLSVNDKLKDEIYFDGNIKENLKTISRMGNEWETGYCLRLICQLILSEKILDDIRSDTYFVSILEYLCQLNNPFLDKYIRQIYWKLKDQNKESQPNTMQVMISYHRDSRDLCLKVKENLEASGHQVWMDVNEKDVSSLDSMGRAVEQCFCVLMCVTEKYRLSVYCQAEAKYAFKLDKPIIPLVMQSGYDSVSGWLNLLINGRVS